MNSDLPAIGFGLGAAGLLIGLVMYLAILALTLWIAFLIIRAAVTSGIMRASQRGAFQSLQQAPYQGAPTHGNHPQNPPPGGPPQGF